MKGTAITLTSSGKVDRRNQLYLKFKTCEVCNTEKPIEQFSYHGSYNETHVSAKCRDCRIIEAASFEDPLALSRKRTCKGRCRTIKPLSEFCKADIPTQNNQGRTYECRVCFNERRKGTRKDKYDNKTRNPYGIRATLITKNTIISMKKGEPVSIFFVVPKLAENILRRTKNCESCGKTFVLVSRRQNDPDVPTFDKIVPPKGYVPGNVKVICFRCNELKSNCINPNRFLMIIKYMRGHYAKNL